LRQTYATLLFYYCKKPVVETPFLQCHGPGFKGAENTGRGLVFLKSTEFFNLFLKFKKKKKSQNEPFPGRGVSGEQDRNAHGDISLIFLLDGQ